jgi:uncharacterized protein (DUF39 family)
MLQIERKKAVVFVKERTKRQVREHITKHVEYFDVVFQETFVHKSITFVHVTSFLKTKFNQYGID